MFWGKPSKMLPKIKATDSVARSKTVFFFFSVHDVLSLNELILPLLLLMEMHCLSVRDSLISVIFGNL